MSSVNLEEYNGDDEMQAIQMRDDHIEFESQFSDFEDNESTASNDDRSEQEIPDANLVKTKVVEFPSLELFSKPQGNTLPIPKDYSFIDLSTYLETMKKLERENFFKQFRASLQNNIILKNITEDEELKSIQDSFQLFTKYEVKNSMFDLNGLCLEVITLQKIPQYQQEQWLVKGNQIMIFVHKKSKKIYLGKTIVFNTEQLKKKNGINYGEGIDAAYDSDEEGQRESEKKKKIQNPFKIVDLVQSFKIKMDVFGDIDEFMVDQDDTASKYYLISPHQYWNSLQQNLNCQAQFKNCESIAFPDQTLRGQKGTETFPKYGFINEKFNLDQFKEKMENKIMNSTDLDEFQRIALRHALNNENAIIQGPPGTGKTYLACKIVNLLNKLHKNYSRKPILVVSKKNQSLDQLLLKIKDKNPNIKMLRLGYSTEEKQMKKSTVTSQNGPSKSEYQSFSKIKFGAIHKKLMKHKDLLKQRKENMDFYDEEEVVLPESLQEEIKLRFFQLLQKAINLDNQEYVSEIEKENIYKCWLNGRLDKAEKIRSLLTSVTLTKNQMQRLQAKINLQEVTNEFKIPKNQESVIDHLNGMNCLSQFSVGFRNFLIDNQYVFEIGPLVEEMREYENSMKMMRQIDEYKYQTKMADFISKYQFEVIGMTFTGYHMHFEALQQLNAEIMVVEEASEITEGEFYPILTPNLKHLIQIGDHQQLRPIIKSNTLQNKYNYKMSYFERLITVNKIDVVTLYKQRRMLPQFANFTRLFYGNKYSDHQDACKQDYFPQISKNGMYMLQHSFPDHLNSDRSFTNIYEAIYIQKLVQHLLTNYNINQNQISVLTMYKSQKILIQSKLSWYSECEEVEVSTVDQFQGDENDIIILSCVRSNQDFQSGFVVNDHRINVAFSRARRGFFCIGNFEMLGKVSNTWKKINEMSEIQYSYGIQPASQYINIGEKADEALYYEVLRMEQEGEEYDAQCNFCSGESHLGQCSEENKKRNIDSSMLQNMFQQYTEYFLQEQSDFQQKLLDRQRELEKDYRSQQQSQFQYWGDNEIIRQPTQQIQKQQNSQNKNSQQPKQHNYNNRQPQGQRIQNPRQNNKSIPSIDQFPSLLGLPQATQPRKSSVQQLKPIKLEQQISYAKDEDNEECFNEWTVVGQTNLKRKEYNNVVQNIYNTFKVVKRK